MLELYETHREVFKLLPLPDGEKDFKSTRDSWLKIARVRWNRPGPLGEATQPRIA
jgi:hypothetical protein